MLRTGMQKQAWKIARHSLELGYPLGLSNGGAGGEGNMGEEEEKLEQNNFFVLQTTLRL